MIKIALINPQIVIKGTSGTMIRFIIIQLRLVVPIKKSRTGKVPMLAQRVGIQ